MTYDLLVVGALDGSRLRTALAELAGVPVGAVDVSAGDAEDRDWDAPVLCTVEAAGGDIPWVLDVYLRENGPPVDRAAAHLAAALGVPVLYSAQDYPPSAHWLVEPDGSRTRARVYQEDSSGLVIDAVARRVALLPDVAVQAQPEVIREHHMPTPITDEFRASAGDLPQPLVNRLGAWEAMVARMSAGWPPDGWYPLEYYREDLGIRDALAADLNGGTLPSGFGVALGRVDEAFRAATREVAAEAGGRGWWWSRAPEPPPWEAPSCR